MRVRGQLNRWTARGGLTTETAIPSPNPNHNPNRIRSQVITHFRKLLLGDDLTWYILSVKYVGDMGVISTWDMGWPPLLARILYLPRVEWTVGGAAH